jgi:RNA-directed DNA polymerase
LGIPVILDRCHQARVVNALEPEWEARFEPRSYGFRPGRGCHDAIQAIYQVVKGRDPKRRWVLDADLAGAFDRIAHDHILSQLGSFPARGMIRSWLKAGVVENGRLHRTVEGTPQGGVVSPVLLNIALHGMETAAGVRYSTGKHAGTVMAGCPTVIRYADDLVALCHTRQEALEVKARLAAWLTPRGLAFNEDKTRVVTLDEGSGRAGARCRRCRRSVSPTRPPNRTCPFLSIRLSAGHAMVDRDAGFMQRWFPVVWWLGLFRCPPTARGCCDRGSDIGSLIPRRARRASCLHG